MPGRSGLSAVVQPLKTPGRTVYLLRDCQGKIPTGCGAEAHQWCCTLRHAPQAAGAGPTTFNFRSFDINKVYLCGNVLLKLLRTIRIIKSIAYIASKFSPEDFT